MVHIFLKLPVAKNIKIKNIGMIAKDQPKHATIK